MRFGAKFSEVDSEEGSLGRETRAGGAVVVGDVAGVGEGEGEGEGGG